VGDDTVVDGEALIGDDINAGGGEMERELGLATPALPISAALAAAPAGKGDAEALRACTGTCAANSASGRVASVLLADTDREPMYSSSDVSLPGFEDMNTVSVSGSALTLMGCLTGEERGCSSGMDDSEGVGVGDRNGGGECR
jgi:hypothetical protein